MSGIGYNLIVAFLKITVSHFNTFQHLSKYSKYIVDYHRQESGRECQCSVTVDGTGYAWRVVETCIVAR